MKNISLFIIIILFVSCSQSEKAKTISDIAIENSDPLTSWNEGINKTAIIDYVNDVTNPKSKDFIATSDRIAVFDNDGTMWSEQPIYFQFYFALDRIKELAPKHPEWKNEEPFKSILEDGGKALLNAGSEGITKILLSTHTGMTVTEFDKTVSNWIKTAVHPVKNVAYSDLVYQPMLELLEYLRENDFNIYIVSGGSIEFMRPIICDIYNIPKENILGTSFKTVYDFNNGKPVLNRMPEMDFYDDKGNKPVNIQKNIGKKPVFASGNSDGDLAMLQWTASNKLKSFMLYVHHTDSVREWAYDRKSHIGRLDKGLDEALEKGWTITDMKKDWKVIYPFELN